MQDAQYKIYSASAGSGKTYTLTKAYLLIILSSKYSKSFKALLALTFTNKAVNEMKNRILDSLLQFSHTQNANDATDLFIDIQNTLGIPVEDLQQRARITLKQILHNYAFFDISTIDKFTHRLIRTFAKDLKLRQNFEVILGDDLHLLLEEAVAKLISKAGEDATLTKTLVNFALEKIDDDRSWDIAFDLFKIGKLLFEENHLQHLQKLEHRGIDDFLALKKTLRARIGVLQDALITSAKEGLELLDKNGLEFSDFKSGYFPKFLESVHKADMKVNFDAKWKQNFGNESLYTKSCPEPTRDTIDKLFPEFIKIFQHIKDTYFKGQFLKNAYWNVVPLTILNAIHAEMKTLEIERDLLPIASFNTLISDQIKGQPAPFIYERLGEKYQHFFIDEFQDTSQMQWENLIPLINNALGSEDNYGTKGSLLQVGDAKQAIYRWRGGNAEQFLDLINSDTKPFVVDPSIISLPKNYRSREEIIKFNNDFFTESSRFLESPKYRQLFVEGNEQLQNKKQGGLVKITFIENDQELPEEELYFKEVLKSIDAVKAKSYRLGDICILTRKKSHGVLLADLLTKHNIPIISSESLLLANNRQVSFLVSMLKYCADPKNLQAVYDILIFLSKEHTNRNEFIEKYLKALPLLFFDTYNFDPGYLQQSSLYDGLEYVLRQFNLIDDSDAHITFFMDMVWEEELKEGNNIFTFLKSWENKKNSLSISAPNTMDAVQIMTVHKSKGLEFPIVIYPYANTGIYTDKNSKFWFPVKEKDFHGFEELLISKKKEVADYGITGLEMYTREQHKLELDAFNLLYVAMTRAIDALFIISKKDLKKDGSHNLAYFSGLFIEYLSLKGTWNPSLNVYSFGKLEDKEGESEDTRALHIVPYLYTTKDRAGFKLLTKSGVLWDTEVQLAQTKGNLMHHIMSLINTADDIDTTLDQLIVSGDIDEMDKSELKTKINKIISHPQLESYFSKGKDIRNEKDIFTADGRILRPDRIIIEDNMATIIDYKTGERDTRYHFQVNEYAAALKSMGYKVIHRIIIYIDKTISIEFI